MKKISKMCQTSGLKYLIFFISLGFSLDGLADSWQGSCSVTCSYVLKPSQSCSVTCPPPTETWRWDAECECPGPHDCSPGYGCGPSCRCIQRRRKDGARAFTPRKNQTSKKTNCSPLKGACRLDADCCFNPCSPTSCFQGSCIGSMCLSRGNACRMGCECCSKRCKIDSTSPGFCE